MEHKAVSIRPFIGAKNFEVSRSFYRDLGFQEVILGPNFSYFRTEGIGFYLQDAVLHWGKECFLHDPSGILWHFGEFFHKG